MSPTLSDNGNCGYFRLAFGISGIVQLVFFAIAVFFPSSRPNRRLFLAPSDTGPFGPNDSITFITVPKPQTIDDQIEMAKLVLTVWLSYPSSSVIMFTTESEYDPLHRVLPYINEVFGPNRIHFFSDLPTGYENRTLVRSWFTEGLNLVQNGYICFTNGDIIILPLWMQTAQSIFRAFDSTERATTIVYGTRTDVHRRDGIFEIPLSNSNFLKDLHKYLDSNVRCNNPYGMDIVFVHASFSGLNWDELPDFVVGMCVWDNFFMGWATKYAIQSQ
jgi:hypothetical protein